MTHSFIRVTRVYKPTADVREVRRNNSAVQHAICYPKTVTSAPFFPLMQHVVNEHKPLFHTQNHWISWLQCFRFSLSLTGLKDWLLPSSRRQVPPTRRFLQEPRGVTYQKMTFFIVTAVKTSNLTWSYHLINNLASCEISDVILVVCISIWMFW
jgi:hypothetical protein